MGWSGFEWGAFYWDKQQSTGHKSSVKEFRKATSVCVCAFTKCFYMVLWDPRIAKWWWYTTSKLDYDAGFRREASALRCPEVDPWLRHCHCTLFLLEKALSLGLFYPHSSGTQTTPYLRRLPQKHRGVSIWEVKRKWPWMGRKETSSKQHRQKPPPGHLSSAKQLDPIVIYTWKMQFNTRLRSQSEVV